jgi:hypothetical protein
MATEKNYRRWATIAFVALSISGALLGWSDRGLRDSSYKKSQQLQWVFSPDVARCVVEEWERGQFTSAAERGVVLDTFLFLPSYAVLLMSLCFWYATRFSVLYPDLRRIARRLGWTAIAAAVLDLIENCGQFAEIRGHAFCMAPLTATAAAVKWILVVVVILFIAGVFLYHRLLFGQATTRTL